MVGDNTAVIASVKMLSPTPRVVLRKIVHKLWYSGTLLHLFWVKSDVMPADALSRLKGTDQMSITRATVDVVSKSGTLMSDVRQLTHMGSARVTAHICPLRRCLASIDLHATTFVYMPVSSCVN